MDINRIPELAAQREERANQAFVRLQRELAEITRRRNEALAGKPAPQRKAAEDAP